LPTGGDITDLLYTFTANMKELDDAGLERLAPEAHRVRGPG